MKPNKKTLFIGITGGVGAGKTEILNYIRKHYKCEIYLADEVAHLVKLPGTACYKELIALLGNQIVDDNGLLNKQKMAEIIFANQEILDKVNQILHPAVRTFLLSRWEEAKQSGSVELFFVEAALLIETGYSELVDEMWYVHATEEVRRERLRHARGYTDEKISQIMMHQLSEDKYRKACDFVIENSGSIEETFGQIKQKLEAYTWRE